MKWNTIDPRDAASDFAMQLGIDVMADHRALHTTRLQLVELDASGTTVQHIEVDGADYEYSELAYMRQDGVLRASRKIASILAGNRTELAYWSIVAPSMQLAVHQGEGRLAIGNPVEGSTNLYRLDSEVTPTVTLPAGRCYTLEADEDSPESFVVSGLYDALLEVDWETAETPFAPGQGEVEAPEGLITIPHEFRLIYGRPTT